MTNTIVLGNPYAGSPHAQVDEGDVASGSPTVGSYEGSSTRGTKSSRGSLLGGDMHFVLATTLFAIVAGIVTGGQAADYTLAAGESDTLSSGAYNAMKVNGDLTLKEGASKSAVTAATMNVGGDITHGYGSVTIEGLPSLTLTDAMTLDAIAGDESMDPVSYLAFKGGAITTKTFANDTDRAALIDVHGGATITFVNGSDTPYFSKGTHRIVLHEGADLKIEQSLPNQFVVDSANALLAVSGKGDLAFSIRVERGRYLTLGAGLSLDFDGDLNLVPTWTDRTGNFRITAGDILGPNVKTLKSVWNYEHSNVRIEVGADVVLKVPDVDIVTAVAPDKTAELAGQSGAVILVDATAEARSFKANIARNDLLTICVTGTHDVVVSQTTNISHLALMPESCVRITTPCIIQDLTVGANAQLVADGCEVVLEQGFVTAKHGVDRAYRTANGGRFVVASAGTTWIRDPDPGLTGYHFTSGSNVFSRIGLDYTYWRFTFKKTANGLLNIRGVYLFDNDGNWVDNLDSNCYVAPATEVSYQPIAAGKCRFYHSSATNVAVTSTAQTFQQLKALYTSFVTEGSGNTFPVLSSPVLDEMNPDSYLAVEFALTNGHERVTGYNLRFYNKEAYMQTWDVEVSNDGENWTLVDRRHDEVPTGTTGNGRTMDGTKYEQDVFNAHEFYTFDNNRVDGLVQGNPFSLQVDGGAAADLRAYAGGCTVNELTIDADESVSGVVYGAKLAEVGTVYVTLSSGELPAEFPLRMPDVSASDNLAKWQVVVNGVPSRRRLCVKDGVVTLQKNGLILLFR